MTIQRTGVCRVEEIACTAVAMTHLRYEEVMSRLFELDGGFALLYKLCEYLTDIILHLKIANRNVNTDYLCLHSPC